MKPSDIYVVTPAWVVYLRYKGVWDWTDLYKTMADWFKDRKYNFHEVFHKHKKHSPFGSERQYKWLANRREEDYVEYNIFVYIRTYDTHDFVVTLPGGKKKITHQRQDMD